MHPCRMQVLTVESIQAQPPPDAAHCLLESGFNVVLQMPTGAGKTHRAAVAIRHALEAERRAIYVTPTRALANELYTRWSRIWSDARVGVFTGDYGNEQPYPVSFAQAQVLIMTPERLDLCTRQWRQHWQWLPEVDLVVLDEFHLLADSQRGPRLEGAIVRLRELNPFARVVGLSATLGNAVELADWLDGASHVSTQRPIATTWRTLTYNRADQKPGLLLEVVRPLAAMGAKSLVFVQSKRRAEQLAGLLREQGIAAEHHHGGLQFEERRDVEERFRQRSLDVLVATGTLEVGLNLPVRQVVLYDLQQFDGSEFRPLSVISVWQRAGRAGRPGLDDKGEVVLFRARWERDVGYEHGRFESIESRLAHREHLAEQVIVAVSSGFARDRQELRQLAQATLASRQGLLADLELAVSAMCEAGFVSEEPASTDDNAKLRLRATALGRICTRLQVSPETILRMKKLLAQDDALTYLDLLLLCCCLPDSDQVLTVDFEELESLGEQLARRRSHLLSGDIRAMLGPLQLAPKRMLAGVKGSLVLLAWTDSGDAQHVAQALCCYPSEVMRLKDMTLRLLSALRAILKLPQDDGGLTAIRAQGLDQKVARLELMVAAGLDEEAATLTLVSGIGKKWARRLKEAGVGDIEALAQADVSTLLGLGSLSPRRAVQWIEVATTLLSSDALWAPLDVASRVGVQHTPIPLGIDVYRLKRSWQLEAFAMSQPDTFAVRGGADPHRVQRTAAAWCCDCLDYGKGHECKHILATKRLLRDPVVLQADQALQAQPKDERIDLQAWWAK